MRLLKLGRALPSVWAALLSLAATSGCTPLDVDQPWGFTERRQLHRGPLERRALADDDYSIAIPLGIDRREVVFAATNSLQIGQHVRVLTPERAAYSLPIISSLGECVIGRGSRIGNLYAMGPSPTLEDGVQVDGFVKSFGPFAGHGQYPVLDHVEPFTEEFRWRVRTLTQPGEGPSVVSRTDRPVLDLPPGRYGALVVEGGGVLRLHAGAYYLDSLALRAGGALQMDNTTQPVTIWVKRSLLIAGAMLEYADEPSILLGYLGTEAPMIFAPLRATLVAPNASVHLPATHTPHCGAVFARSIAIDDDAEFEWRTFAGWRFSPEDPSVVCSRCAMLAAATIGSCCDKFEDEMNDRRTAASLRALAARLDPNVATDPSSFAAPLSNPSQARASLEACELASLQRFTACEQHYNLRADTCENLGHHPDLAPRCTQ